jgi:hypothetical protein
MGICQWVASGVRVDLVQSETTLNGQASRPALATQLEALNGIVAARDGPRRAAGHAARAIDVDREGRARGRAAGLIGDASESSDDAGGLSDAAGDSRGDVEAMSDGGMEWSEDEPERSGDNLESSSDELVAREADFERNDGEVEWNDAQSLRAATTSK